MSEEDSKEAYASWMKGEEAYRDNREDYWFLRKNGVNAKTTLKMLAMAYSPQQNKEEEAGEAEKR